MTHIPALLKETIEILNPQPGEFFIDSTLGSAGHALEIIKKISPGGIFLGVDWDKDSVEKSAARIKQKKTDLKKLIFTCANYADLPEILKMVRQAHHKKEKLGREGSEVKVLLPSKADGILLDLGISSDQLENSGRGFSFLKDEPLDMRYNADLRGLNADLHGQDAASSLTAGEVINTFSKKELADIFWKYGEEKFADRIADEIVKNRKKRKIGTTKDLVNVVLRALPRRTKIHPATRIFMALRIFINRELENLERILLKAPEILQNNGRLAIISFHSLEDRIVKNHFRDLAKQGMVEILTKKPIRPSWQEIQENPKSRSAKLRAIRLITNNQ